MATTDHAEKPIHPTLPYRLTFALPTSPRCPNCGVPLTATTTYVLTDLALCTRCAEPLEMLVHNIRLRMLHPDHAKNVYNRTGVLFWLPPVPISQYPFCSIHDYGDQKRLAEANRPHPTPPTLRPADEPPPQEKPPRPPEPPDLFADQETSRQRVQAAIDHVDPPPRCLTSTTHNSPSRYTLARLLTDSPSLNKDQTDEPTT